MTFNVVCVSPAGPGPSTTCSPCSVNPYPRPKGVPVRGEPSKAEPLGWGPKEGPGSPWRSSCGQGS